MIYHILKENNRYAVYGDGTVYDIKKDKTVKPYKPNKYNNCYVRLYNKDAKHTHKYSLAKLVAQYFVPNSNPTVYKYIKHINGNIKDNQPSNLRWCKKRNGVYGARNGARKRCKPVLVYNKDTGAFVREFSSLKEVASWLQEQGAGEYVYTMVSHALTGRRPSYYGYIYKYKNSRQEHQANIPVKHTAVRKKYTYNKNIEQGKQNSNSKYIKNEAVHILMYKAKTHKFVCEFASLKEAGNWFIENKGASSHVQGNISGCLHGYQKTCFGYTFEYRYPNIAKKYNKTTPKKHKIARQKSKEQTIKPIFQYDMQGKLVKYYPNIYIALKDNDNFTYSGLYNALHKNRVDGGKLTYKGYYWFGYSEPIDISVLKTKSASVV